MRVRKTSRSFLSAAVLLFALSTGVLRSGMAAEGVHELPPLPSPPSGLSIDKAGHLYALVSGRVRTLDLKADQGQWELVDLTKAMDMTRNREGRAFVRCDQGDFYTFWELKGSSAQLVLKHPAFKCEGWYVDAEDRVWIQSREKLVIASGDAEPQVITWPQGQYGFRLRKPCEWQPGHVVLFYGTAMVWASPKGIEVKDAPRFAADGTGKGPFLLGSHLLVSGGGNTMGSYVMDVRAPDEAPRRVWLGWDWFFGVASAPDGQVLVLAQTDHNPQFTLFWYAQDGQSDVRLKGAEDVLRAGLSKQTLSGVKVAFNSQGQAFVALTSGLLGVVDADSATVMTSAQGLPLEPIADLAALGDDLVLAGDDGRFVVWDTRVKLAPLSAESFDSRAEWTLAGPCCVDAAGKMWAFLADFPGKLNCYDGKHWEHVPIDLGNRRPLCMTADDLGNLEISFQDYPAGSCLYSGGRFQFWTDDPTRAWRESLQLGAKSFFDGSGFRTQHWTDGSGKGWFYNGRILSEGGGQADYYDRPPYGYWWANADDGWYRLSGTHAMVYRRGRWGAMDEAPQHLYLGSRGLRTADAAWPEGGRADELPVEFRNATAYVLSPQGIGRGDDARKSPLLEHRLNPNAIFRASDAGGGWIGSDRYVLGVFPVSALGSKVYEANCGRFFLETKGRQSKLRYHRPTDLTIAGDVTEGADAWSVTCRITGDPPPRDPCVVVETDGVVTGTPADPSEVRVAVDPYHEQRVTLHAVDRLGDFSSEPLVLHVKYPLYFHLPADDDVRHRWSALPKRLSKEGASGKPLTIGTHLASDPDGNMWMTTSDANSLLRYASTTGECELVKAPEPLVLINSPDGRAWGLGSAPKGPGERPLYSLSARGIEHATGIYYDWEPGPRSIAWDTEGNLWACALRWVGRWDGNQWTEWERPVGYGARVLTGVGGRAVVMCAEGFLVYAHGELSRIHTLPDGWRFEGGTYCMGDRYLVGPCERERAGGGSEDATGIFDLETGELDVRSLPAGVVLRPDGEGDLYVWEIRQKGFFLLQSDGQRQLDLPNCPPPSRQNAVGERTFFRTKRGVLICLRPSSPVVAWSEESGQQEVQPRRWRQRGKDVGIGGRRPGARVDGARLAVADIRCQRSGRGGVARGLGAAVRPRRVGALQASTVTPSEKWRTAVLTAREGMGRRSPCVVVPL